MKNEVLKYVSECKWIDKSKFGIMSKDKSSFAYYDLELQDVVSNMVFGNDDF